MKDELILKNFKRIDNRIDEISEGVKFLGRAIDQHDHVHQPKPQNRTIQERNHIIALLQKEKVKNTILKDEIDRLNKQLDKLQHDHDWEMEQRQRANERNTELNRLFSDQTKEINVLKLQLKQYETAPFVSISKTEFNNWRDELNKLSAIVKIIKEGR
jgi:predicted RNase H-like nuclease (RuvC/YqgF family)